MSTTEVTARVCVLVLAWAVVAVVWLKREGDRAWAEHQRAAARRAAIERMGEQINARLIPAMQQIRVAFAQMSRSMAKARAEIEKSMRDG